MALTRIKSDSITTGVVEGKVDAHLSGGTGITLSSGVIAVDSTIATNASVTAAIDGLIDSAPGALNTLNELAASLGDDADFANTVTTSIAAKLPNAGGTLTGPLTINDTSATRVSAGTTAQRTSGTAGDFRYNSTTGKFEGYSSSWGDIGGGANFTLNQFTGDGSTTIFTLAGSAVEELNSLLYLDGVYQSKSNYDLSGTTLTFSPAPASGVSIELMGIVMSPPTTSNQFTLNQFTGDGSTVAYTLTLSPLSDNETSVYINGVYQSKSNYSVSGTTLTFTTAPPTGTSVEIMVASSVVVSISTPNDGTVTTSKIVDSAVTSAKIANGSVTADKLAAGAGGAFNDFVIKTASYTAVARDQIITNKAVAAPATYAVTVSGGVFHIDASANPVLVLTRGITYTFTQSDSTNANHPIAFKDTAGNSYTTGVTSTGTPGNAGAQTVFVVPANAPLGGLRYYCTVHGNGMGNTINIVEPGLTITLPVSPVAGNSIFIKNAGAATVTVGRNGSNINSTADDGELITDAAATLVYVDGTIGWKEL